MGFLTRHLRELDFWAAVFGTLATLMVYSEYIGGTAGITSLDYWLLAIFAGVVLGFLWKLSPLPDRL